MPFLIPAAASTAPLSSTAFDHSPASFESPAAPPSAAAAATPFVDVQPLGALGSGPIRAAQAQLCSSLNRVWPTRYTAKVPPAYATLLPLGRVDLPCDSVLLESQQVLVVFLPEDWTGRLHLLLQQAPAIRVHTDLGLRSHCAYLSLELPASQPPAAFAAATAQGGGQPSRATPAPAVWLRLEAVLDALAENRLEAGGDVLPLLLVTEQEALLATFVPDAGWMERAARAVQAASQPPRAASAEELQRAAEKARRYSEQPWLFMRYELYNRGQRLAVNLAPLERVEL